MGGQPIPQQGGLLPTQKPAQLRKDLDQGVGLVVAGDDVEGQLGTAAAEALASLLQPPATLLQDSPAVTPSPSAAHRHNG
jgi:hypothetical protein